MTTQKPGTKLLEALNAFMTANKETDPQRREAQLLAAQELAGAALLQQDDTGKAVDIAHLLAEAEQLRRANDKLLANEKRLINELFDARQATPQRAPEALPQGADFNGTYADGLREAARLIEFWMTNDQVRSSFNGYENRDATRILFFMPDRLRDCAAHNSSPPDWQAPDLSAPVPEPITRTERALFELMNRTCDFQASSPTESITELELARNTFERSAHHFRGESPADRIANWRVWIDAWQTRAAQSIAGPVVQRQMHMDEIDAATAGQAFIQAKIEELGKQGKELRYSDNDGSAMAKVKWCALFDTYNNLRAAYLLNRDLMNWTQLTLVLPPAPPSAFRDFP